MKRTLTVALALVLVLAPVVVLGHGGGSAPASDQRATANVSPGGQLAGVVSAGQAEVDGAYERRRLAATLARADSDEARAAILADARDSLADQLDDLRDDLDEVDDDDVEDGEYTARLAGIVANARTVQQEARRAGALANRIPDDVRTEYGIENGTFADIRQQAAALVDADSESYVSGVVGDDVGDEFEGEEDDEDEGGEAETDGDGSDGDGTDGDGIDGNETDGTGDDVSDTGDGTTTDGGDGSDGDDEDAALQSTASAVSESTPAG